MGSPTSVLGTARAFARDFARDQMPRNYLWDVIDFVPQLIDAGLTNRGKWYWGSAATGFGEIESGILATFRNGDQILVQTRGGADQVTNPAHLLRLNVGAAGTDQGTWTWTDLGATHRAAQNPVQLGNEAVHCDAAGVRVPQLWREGVPVTAYANMGRPKFATAWSAALIYGGGQAPDGSDEQHMLRASLAGEDLATAASFDANAFQPTSAKITALRTMRSMVLVFHPSSIERLRGGPLWNTAEGETGEGLILDTLTERVGCKDPRSIANWNEFVIFADEHGIHMTDGAVVRNIAEQGGISYYWRLLYEGAASVVATTFLDYYIVTVRHPAVRPPLPGDDWYSEDPPASGFGAELLQDIPPPPDPQPRPPIPPIPDDLPEIRPPPPEMHPDTYTTTLVCDLNKKQWFRFSNMNAVTYFASGGTTGMERIWAGFSGYDRLIRIGPTFYPDAGLPQVDDDGWVVKPRIETPWYRLGNEGRKRLRFGYMSYDCRTFDGNDLPVRIGYAVTPQNEGNYRAISLFPNTNDYRRFRFALNRAPYGIMFFVEAVQPIGALRIFDLAIEGEPMERSRA